MSDESVRVPLAISERYKIARAQIEHENGLVAARITWFLTLQGLLFTAFFLTAQLPWKEHAECFGGLTIVAVAGTWVVGVLGIASALLVFWLLRLAVVELRRIYEWWAEQKSPKGDFPLENSKHPSLTADLFALVFVVLWGVLLGAFHIGSGPERASAFTWYQSGVQSSQESAATCQKRLKQKTAESDFGFPRYV